MDRHAVAFPVEGLITSATELLVMVRTHLVLSSDRDAAAVFGADAEVAAVAFSE